jgi:hypothetical protein
MSLLFSKFYDGFHFTQKVLTVAYRLDEICPLVTALAFLLVSYSLTCSSHIGHFDIT